MAKLKQKPFACLPFTQKDIKNYLDQCITLWRGKKDKAEKLAFNSKSISALIDYAQAINYIDCFQSIRISIFGEILE